MSPLEFSLLARQRLRFAATSLMIGNTIVLKPVSAAETLIDSDVSAVTFTGSVPVGAKSSREILK